jgi:hypothetical protein
MPITPKTGSLFHADSHHCGQLDARAVIRPEPSEWRPRMPECLDEEELADWRAGGNAVYQLAALTIGARLAVADG